MLGKWIVKVANLVEAEGRAARRGAYHLSLIIGANLVLGLVFLSGLGVITYGIYEVLLGVVSRPAACIVVGTGLMLISGCLGLFIHRMMDRRSLRYVPPRSERGAEEHRSDRSDAGRADTEPRPGRPARDRIHYEKEVI